MATELKKKSFDLNLENTEPSSTSVSGMSKEEQFDVNQYHNYLSQLDYKDVKASDPPDKKTKIGFSGNLFSPVSLTHTPEYKSYKDEKKLEEDWFDVKSRQYGSITEDKRNIVQRKADDFYESGPIGAGAAAVADLLPGIPFVDVIDPPAQLADESSQTSRNLLGALGMGVGTFGTPKAIGRVATNLRIPYGYQSNIGSMTANTGFHYKKPTTWIPALKKATKSVRKDEPLYGFFNKDKTSPMLNTGSATDDAREFLYRKTFGLEPRIGKNIFKQNKDGTLSFNLDSKRGRILAENAYNTQSPSHSVMGGYSRKELGKGVVDIEDIWDFKMNKDDWSRLKRKFGNWARTGFDPKLYKEHLHGLPSQAVLRTFINTITTPPHIKQRLTPGDMGLTAKALGLMKKTANYNFNSPTIAKAHSMNAPQYTKRAIQGGFRKAAPPKINPNLVKNFQHHLNRSGVNLKNPHGY